MITCQEGAGNNGLLELEEVLGGLMEGLDDGGQGGSGEDGQGGSSEGGQGGSCEGGQGSSGDNIENLMYDIDLSE